MLKSKAILVAPNYLKGSLSAIDAAQAIREGIQSVNPEMRIYTCPIADGGDGTLDAIKYSCAFEEVTTEVTGPLGGKVSAKWIMIEDNNVKTAVIESAQANGLSLLKPHEYNPLATTSYGVGELIQEALRNQCRKIIVTMGGSSTNDGGVGLLQALGVQFLDSSGKNLGFGGMALAKLDRIDLGNVQKVFDGVEVVVACDVNNPLCGDQGASYIYGPQKGASPVDILVLDKNLKILADCSAKILGYDESMKSGSGAAGGLGFALKAFLGARFASGFDLVAQLTHLETYLPQSFFVITTEGRLDSQSLHGKAPFRLIQLAGQYHIPSVILAGSLEEDFSIPSSYQVSYFSIMNAPMSLEYAMKNAYKLLYVKMQAITRFMTFL